MTRAALWEGNGPHLEIGEITIAAPGPHEVIVDTTAVVTCVTDVMILRSDPVTQGAPVPQIPGHGGVGVISAIGSAVSRVKEGDFVLAAANAWCGECYACVRGRPDQCALIAFDGPLHAASGGRQAMIGSYMGSYADQFLTRDSQVVPLDPDISAGALAVLADGGAGGLGGAMLVAPVTRGASVAVFGCGMTGLSYLQGAALQGAETIIAVDPRPGRLAEAAKFGATHTLDAADPDLIEKVKEIAGGYWMRNKDGRGVEFAFEATGDARAMESAVAAVRPTGTAVLAGLPWDFTTATITIPAFDAAMNGKRIIGCQWGEANLLRDVPVWSRMIQRGDIDFDSMITRRYSLEEVNEAVSDVGSYQVVAALLEPRR